MGIYYSLLILCLIFYVPIFFGKEYTSRFFIFLAYFVLFLFSIFRTNIGIDYNTHVEAYHGISSNILAYRTIYKREFLFYFICRFSGILNLDYRIFVGIISFLTIYPIYKLTKRNNYIYIIIFFICACYTTSFCLMRQFAAISLATYGIYLYYKEHKRRAWILLLSSCGMHTSMIFLVILFIAAKKFCNLKILCNSVSAYIFTLIFLIFSIIFAKKGISIIASFGGYGHYLVAGNQNGDKVQLGTGLGVVVRFISYFFLLYINNFSIYRNEKTKPIFNFLFLALILFDVLSCSIIIFLRMRFVFYPILYYFPIFANLNNKKKSISYFSFPIILLICLSYIVFYEPTTKMWGNIPYQTWF